MAIGSGTFFSIRHMYTWFLFGFVLFFLPFLAIFQHTHTKTRKKQYYRFLCAFFAHCLCTFRLAIVDRADFCFSCEPFCLVFQINHTYFRSFVFFIRCVHMHTTNTIIMDVNRIGPNSTLIHSNRKLFRTNREKKTRAHYFTYSTISCWLWMGVLEIRLWWYVA